MTAQVVMILASVDVTGKLRKARRVFAAVCEFNIYHSPRSQDILHGRPAEPVAQWWSPSRSTQVQRPRPLASHACRWNEVCPVNQGWKQGCMTCLRRPLNAIAQYRQQVPGLWGKEGR